MEPWANNKFGEGSSQKSDDSNPSKWSPLDHESDFKIKYKESETHSKDCQTQNAERKEDKDKFAKPDHLKIDDKLKPPNFDGVLSSSSPSSSSSEKLLKDFVPVSSLPLAEAIMSIPRILQRILHYSSPQDLLRFRLVSGEWRKEATNDTLLNWDRNRMCIDTKLEGGKFYACHSNQDEKFKKPLQDWTELMNKTGSNPFPCSRFLIYFHRTNKDDETDLGVFLDNHGARINTLFFESIYFYKECDEIVENYNAVCSHVEKWLIKFLTKLILEQAQNLKSISLSFSRSKNIRGSKCTSMISSDDDERKKTIGRFKNTNLESVSFAQNSVPQSVFELFCKLAPNLRILRDLNLNRYYEPTNRLYLLEQIRYIPIYSFRYSHVSNIEEIANMETELYVTHLVINTDYIRFHPGHWQHVADISNQLLTKCARSLKTLRLSPLGFLPEFKFPKMPNLNHLSLSGDGQFQRETTKFFPRGMRLSETFPKLYKIELAYNIFKENEQDVVVCDRLILGCKVDDVVLSVRVITTDGKPIDLELFQLLFPNARLDLN